MLDQAGANQAGANQAGADQPGADQPVRPFQILIFRRTTLPSLPEERERLLNQQTNVTVKVNQGVYLAFSGSRWNRFFFSE